jgi:hypothetical protein
MTSDNYTSMERRRLQALHMRQHQQQLTPDELAETNRLERRDDAEKFCEGVYAAMGSDLNIERALDGVYQGLCLVTAAKDAHDRVRGLTMALEAVLDEPDALMAAVRMLLRNLEPDAE